MKTAANLPKAWTIKPFVDLTLLTFCISAFSINQLKIASTGCLTFETAVENKSSAAFSLFFITSGIPFTALTGAFQSSDIPTSADSGRLQSKFHRPQKSCFQCPTMHL